MVNEYPPPHILNRRDRFGTDTASDTGSNPQVPLALRFAGLWGWGKLALQVILPVLVIALVWYELHALDMHRVRLELSQADIGLALWGVAAALLAVMVMGAVRRGGVPAGRGRDADVWQALVAGLGDLRVDELHLDGRDRRAGDAGVRLPAVRAERAGDHARICRALRSDRRRV